MDNDGVQCEPRATCALCGAAGSVLHDQLIDLDFGAPGVWSIRQCDDPACGLAWSDPQPLPAEVGKFYAQYYTHDGAQDAAGAPVPGSFDSIGRTRLAKRALALLLPWRRRAFQSDRYYLQGLPPGRLLDIGCGNGDFIGAMAAHGWDAHGVDFDAAAIRVASRYPGVSAAVGDVASQAYPADHFDAIVMSNVIEHVPDPMAVFAECRRILRPGGRLVMITPNFAALGHRRFGRDWRGLEPPRHLFLFQPSSMRAMARAKGFTRFDVFTSPGDRSAHGYVIEASQRHREHAGLPRLDIPGGSLIRQERLLDLIGKPCGEWVVLVAHKDSADA